MKSLKRYRDDIYNCAQTRCGFCAIECPTYREYELETYTARGRNVLLRLLLDESIKPTQEIAEHFFQCAICGYCETRCAVPLASIFETARADFVQQGLQVEKHQKFAENVVQNHNPYNEPHDQRELWLETPLSKSDAELGFFVGCTSSYREQEMARNTVTILESANIPFTILDDERCCGSPLLRTGQRELATNLAKHNLKKIKDQGLKRLVTSCAGCYRTLLIDYPELLGEESNIEIIHIVQLLKELIELGQLKFREASATTNITYHDPCHLNRHTNLDYDVPRTILNNIPGINLIEMEWTRDNAHCCGAGGGVKSGFPDLALGIGMRRIMEATDTGAKILVTPCPFCKRNFKDAANKLNLDMEILDITELITRYIQKAE